jgi:hypothetical protein
MLKKVIWTLEKSILICYHARSLILGKRNHTIDLPFSVSYCLKAVLVLGYENPSGLHFSVWIDIDIFAPVAVQCSVK